MTDYYQVLGVDKNADVKMIKRKYRELARKHHPDRGGDPEMFKKIAEAYEILSDTSRRAQYDSERDYSTRNISPFSGVHMQRSSRQMHGTHINFGGIRMNFNANVSFRSSKTVTNGRIRTETITDTQNGVTTTTIKTTDLSTGVTTIKQC